MADKKKCGGKTRAGGDCGRPAGWGTDHPGVGKCKLHGGSTPNHKKAAQRAIALQAVERFGLASVGHQIEQIDPRDVLAQELWRTQVTVKGLDVVVGELGRDVYGELYHQTGKRTGEAKPNILWVMWQDQRQHLTKVAAEAHKAGIEARRMEIDEERALQIADIFRLVFGNPALKLSKAQKSAAITVTAEHLRQLGSGT